MEGSKMRYNLSSRLKGTLPGYGSISVWVQKYFVLKLLNTIIIFLVILSFW